MTSLKTINTQTLDKDAFALFVFSLFSVFLLFFIDEGLFSFQWMTNIGAWFVFFVYVAVLFVSQLFFTALIFKHFTSFYRLLFSGLIGAFIGLFFLYSLF